MTRKYLEDYMERLSDNEEEEEEDEDEDEDEDEEIGILRDYVDFVLKLESAIKKSNKQKIQKYMKTLVELTKETKRIIY